MSLTDYFSALIEKVETTNQFNNAGKDASGFFKPTRTILLRNLNLLKDLHDKPRAKPMIQAAWAAVAEELPPEWLILKEDDRRALQKVLD